FEAWFTGDPSNGNFEYRERSGRFSDFFNLIFSNQQGGATAERAATRTRPRRGQDIEIIASVSLREAMTGTARQVSINAPEPCATCHGTGYARNMECPTCDGTGTVTRSKRLEVRIPAGVHSGSRVRVAAQGGPGESGGPPGDVYLAITVAPDSRFTVKGSDLVTRIKVPLYTAVLGGEIVVDTVVSHVALNIPPGTQQGRTYKLRGKGMPKLGSTSDERGDLLVETEIEIPDDLSERERELFMELQSLRQ
ncbi:MAG: DnaJ C-terminal domain-containing protein, partial [Thermomicrobiales bacterium]